MMSHFAQVANAAPMRGFFVFPASQQLLQDRSHVRS
jgi:hypothetical protein